jgi:hypothetical protein
MDIRKVNAAIALASNEHFKRDMNFKGNAV